MAIGAESRKVTPPQEPPRPSQVRREIQGLPGPQNDKTGARGVLPEHRFTLNYTDPRGHVWSGGFRCHVLNYRERIQVGLFRARMSAGVPADALDTNTLDLLEMISHLSVALDEVPEWADVDKMMELYEWRVIAEVYREVSLHEARFHGTVGGAAGQDPGADRAGPDGEGVVPSDTDAPEAHG